MVISTCIVFSKVSISTTYIISTICWFMNPSFMSFLFLVQKTMFFCVGLVLPPSPIFTSNSNNGFFHLLSLINLTSHCWSGRSSPFSASREVEAEPISTTAQKACFFCQLLFHDLPSLITLFRAHLLSMQGRCIPDWCVPERKLLDIAPLVYLSLGLIIPERWVSTLDRMKELVNDNKTIWVVSHTQ